MDAILSASEAVDMAKQVEDAGEAFYDEALKYLEDPEVRKIFEFLRDEEQRHAATFEQILETMGEESGGWREDDEYVSYIRLLAGTQVFPDAPAARAAVKGATATGVPGCACRSCRGQGRHCHRSASPGDRVREGLHPVPPRDTPDGREGQP
ncbi:MAG: hypothetical protein JRJ84_23385 [Deltaproteobacteria bacterium]|nr:hypothetical protein [Deltaproteobacteria bacterium]